MSLEQQKQEILNKVREYYQQKYGTLKEFTPGKSFVNYGGRFFNAEEMVNLVDSSLDFWLTAGPWASRFEKAFADTVNILGFSCQEIIYKGEVLGYKLHIDYTNPME